MKCKQVSDLASWYVDGDLPPGKRSAIEAHLSECSACRAEVEAMRRAVYALERAKKVCQAPDVLAAVKSRVSVQPRVMPAYRWGLAAACTMAMVLGVWLGAGLRAPSPAPTRQVAVTQTEQPAPPVVKPEAAPSRADKPHARPRRFVAVKPPAPEVAHDPQPEITYLVVFNPEPPVTEDSYLESEVGESTVTSSYSIRSVDEATGVTTTVEVRREAGPGSEENTVINYEVEDTEPHGDEEGSPENEGLINRIDPAADPFVT